MVCNISTFLLSEPDFFDQTITDAPPTNPPEVKDNDIGLIMGMVILSIVLIIAIGGVYVMYRQGRLDDTIERLSCCGYGESLVPHVGGLDSWSQ